MAISTTVRNILFITIFAYIYSASSVLHGGMHPRSYEYVPVLQYVCNCSHVDSIDSGNAQVHVKKCSCADHVNGSAVFTFNCSLANKTWDYVKNCRPGDCGMNVKYKRSVVREQPSKDDRETASGSRMKRARFLRETGAMRSPSSEQYSTSLLPSSSAGVQPSKNDTAAKVLQTSADHQSKGTTPVGNRDTSGHIVGSIQAQTTAGSSVKKEATSPKDVQYANRRTLDRASLSLSHAETGEKHSGRTHPVSNGDPSGRMVDKTGSVLETKETGLVNRNRRSSDAEDVQKIPIDKSSEWEFLFTTCKYPFSCSCTCKLVVDYSGILCTCKLYAEWQCKEENMWIHPDPRAKYHTDPGITLLWLLPRDPL